MLRLFITLVYLQAIMQIQQGMERLRTVAPEVFQSMGFPQLPPNLVPPAAVPPTSAAPASAAAPASPGAAPATGSSPAAPAPGALPGININP